MARQGSTCADPESKHGGRFLLLPATLGLDSVKWKWKFKSKIKIKMGGCLMPLCQSHLS